MLKTVFRLVGAAVVIAAVASSPQLRHDASVAVNAAANYVADRTSPETNPIPSAPTDSSSVVDAAALAAGPGEHSWSELRADGTPITWPACATVTWAHNPAGAPAGADELVAAAVGRLADASGLNFVHVGTTDASVSGNDQHTIGARVAAGGPHIVVGWLPSGADIGAGVNGRALVANDGVHIVGATVIINTSRVGALTMDFGPYSFGALLTHELGHTVGLGHVDSPGEIMTTHAGNAPATFGPGDRTALAALATGC